MSTLSDRIRMERILYSIFTRINLKQGAAALFYCWQRNL